jgi:hypothetical protein
MSHGGVVTKCTLRTPANGASGKKAIERVKRRYSDCRLQRQVAPDCAEDNTTVTDAVLVALMTSLEARCGWVSRKCHVPQDGSWSTLLPMFVQNA